MTEEESHQIKNSIPSRRSKIHQKKRPNSPKKPFLIFLTIILVIGGFSTYRYFSHHYHAARQAANKIYQKSNVKKLRNVDQVLKQRKPVALLVMGTDTGALGRGKDFKGRTDTMMVVVLNPQQKKMTIVSIPRDTLAPIPGYGEYAPAKINAAYFFGGSKIAIETVQNYLNIPLDFYATINMGGLEDLIDAVGGVTITPDLTFSIEGHHFTKGKKTHLDGERALAYVRMRHDDPRGDYGRQERQRQVLTKLAFKSAQLETLLNDGFLKKIANKMSTDLTFDDMLYLGTTYRVATHNLETYTLQGKSQMIDGQAFEVVPQSTRDEMTHIIYQALETENADSTALTNNE